LALSETLLRFREMIHETSKRNGPAAFLHGQVPAEAVNAVRDQLRSYDPGALDEGAMWPDELDEIDRERA
jgi:hypothetical protein